MELSENKKIFIVVFNVNAIIKVIDQWCMPPRRRNKDARQGSLVIGLVPRSFIVIFNVDVIIKVIDQWCMTPRRRNTDARLLGERIGVLLG